jgi:hypothetical protein
MLFIDSTAFLQRTATRSYPSTTKHPCTGAFSHLAVYHAQCLLHMGETIALAYPGATTLNKKYQYDDGKDAADNPNNSYMVHIGSPFSLMCKELCKTLCD